MRLNGVEIKVSLGNRQVAIAVKALKLDGNPPPPRAVGSSRTPPSGSSSLCSVRASSFGSARSGTGMTTPP
jgi:hypothetical protein